MEKSQGDIISNRNRENVGGTRNSEGVSIFERQSMKLNPAWS